ncbi:unnamed protein product (mitochondrion) [Plasmodiophora brassicae]|uniref:GTP-binding protein n=1 Tax=Plasmodiophora brassicae TaxID=37360 RepID=A0A0G4J1H7_PLABS|nr:hypothetical protein PBRA_002104 [Plasmodiophora brassicae]SPQ93223.1 unnamed protein product [Plasmodiophora brassicae]
MSYDDFPLSLDSNATSQHPTFAISALQADGRARVFLLGAHRSGKSSIEKVVFHKMSPHETLFLESTRSIGVTDINSNPLVNLQILDFPGGYAFQGVDRVNSLRSCSAMVLVVDATNGSQAAQDVKYLVGCIEVAHRVNPKISFEILIHKVDGDAFPLEEHKLEAQRNTRARIDSELREANIQNVHISYHLTSIYDHTIFEAFSKIYHKMLPQFAFLENLLDSLITNSSIEKAFLFDVISKIYICTDSNPVDMQTYELCSDMIDVVVDISCIYGVPSGVVPANAGKGSEKLATDCAFDSASTSTIKLSNGHVLVLREVGKYLALVCLMREKSFDKAALVEFNINCFKTALSHLCEGMAQG